MSGRRFLIGLAVLLSVLLPGGVAAFAYQQGNVVDLGTQTCTDVAMVSLHPVQWGDKTNITSNYITILPTRGSALFDQALAKAGSGACSNNHKFYVQFGAETLKVPNVTHPDCAPFPDLPQVDCWSYMNVFDTTVTPAVQFSWPLWKSVFTVTNTSMHNADLLQWYYWNGCSTCQGTGTIINNDGTNDAWGPVAGHDSTVCIGCAITVLPSGYSFTDPALDPPPGGTGPTGSPTDPYSVLFPNDDASGSGCSTFDLGCWLSYLFIPDLSTIGTQVDAVYVSAEGQFPVGVVTDAIEALSLIKGAYASEVAYACGGGQQIPGFSANTPGGWIQIYVPDPCDATSVPAQLWGYRAAIRSFLVVSLWVGFFAAIINAWWPTGIGLTGKELSQVDMSAGSEKK